MARIRRRDTKPELKLRSALWAAGLRGYRVDRATLPGRPDLSWGRQRVAVFVDGAFWHGHPSAFTPGKSGPYWDAKIRGNMERDAKHNAALRDLGWTVLRFWDFEIHRSLDQCVGAIRAALERVPGNREE